MVLGFIIFGWPRRTKTYGPTLPEHCDRCDNHTYFFLFKARRWFSLFFIPFLPLGRARRHLVCGICQAGFELDRTAWKRLKAFTPVTRAFDAGELSKAAYLDAYDDVAADLWGEASALEAEESVAAAGAPGEQSAAAGGVSSETP